MLCCCLLPTGQVSRGISGGGGGGGHSSNTFPGTGLTVDLSTLDWLMIDNVRPLKFLFVLALHKLH